MTAQESTAAVTIRAYTDADWPAVCTVHDRARPAELDGSCDPRAFVPLADDQEDRENFQRSQKFVATINGKIVGFSGVDGTYLSWLYVDPAFWGRGIGRHLLRHAVNIIGPQVWTVVLAENARAQCLYKNEGFQVVRTSQGSNAGYPCTSFRLALSPSATAASSNGICRGIDATRSPSPDQRRSANSTRYQ